MIGGKKSKRGLVTENANVGSRKWKIANLLVAI